MRIDESYVRAGAMTAAGRYAPLLEELPGDVAGLAAVAHGLLIHEFIAEAYGVTLAPEERDSVHLRPAEAMLAEIVARDPRPLAAAREPAGRLATNCRGFTVLMVAMLRAHGRPARARCGFGGYFTAGRFEDHWVCEYWDGVRWALVDAQIDERQRELFGIDFDVLDVPRDRFLIAGDAWAASRRGEADPSVFGLTMVNEAGDWWIASNLVRDAAALDNRELLPWDIWGAMPGPDDKIDDELAGLFDRLAALTQAPDVNLGALRALVRGDERLRVPPAVHNYLRQRDETI
ncbi:MAG TPA: transglutaminase-like domain-containing protein [Streptosporangiaceae bacterium]|nr:transglutaminase-like domain-containing protein [Streptosporangiaceae bacterium]